MRSRWGSASGTASEHSSARSHAFDCAIHNPGQLQAPAGRGSNTPGARTRLMRHWGQARMKSQGSQGAAVGARANGSPALQRRATRYASVEVLRYQRFTRFWEIVAGNPELVACWGQLERAGYSVDLSALGLGPAKLPKRADLAWRVLLALKHHCRDRLAPLRCSEVIERQGRSHCVLRLCHAGCVAEARLRRRTSGATRGPPAPTRHGCG